MVSRCGLYVPEYPFGYVPYILVVWVLYNVASAQRKGWYYGY